MIAVISDPRGFADGLFHLFVFGGEESYGYLASDRVRDKDANAAVIMFCEAAYLQSQENHSGIPRFSLPTAGYSRKHHQYLLRGRAGAKTVNIWPLATVRPPLVTQVTGFTDFGREITDVDGSIRRISTF